MSVTGRLLNDILAHVSSRKWSMTWKCYSDDTFDIIEFTKLDS